MPVLGSGHPAKVIRGRAGMRSRLYGMSLPSPPVGGPMWCALLGVRLPEYGTRKGGRHGGARMR